MAARRAHVALAWCVSCQASHLAVLTPIRGGWLLECPVAGPTPYAAALPASDPLTIAPGACRPRRTNPRPPRPVGRPRKAA